MITAATTPTSTGTAATSHRLATAVATELRKLRTTRLWWVLLIGMAAYMATLAAALALAITQSPGELGGSHLDQVRSVYTIATSLGYVFPAVVGTLAVTSEFRHRTIVPTLLSDPSRTRLVVAKMIASLPFGFLFGVVGTAAGTLAGAGVLAATGADPLLTSPEVWRSVMLAVVALTVWTVVGVGLGTAVPNQVAAIIVLLGFTQLVEPTLRFALPALGSAGGTVASFLPGAAGEALAEASLFSALSMSDIMSWWAGGLVLLAYAAVLGALGRFTTLRGDIA